MASIFASKNKVYKYSGAYDPNEKKYHSISYRPSNWAADTEYKKGVDVVISTTPNGLMYECTSGGISGSTEPTFGTVEAATTTDNSVVWTAKAYDLLLNTGDSITASTWRLSSDTDWIALATVVAGTDTVVPTTPNGFAFDCTTSGTTGASEPTWPTVSGSTITDGTAVFTARSIGTLDNDSITGGIQTKFRLTSVPSGADSVTVVNHISVTRSNGDLEEFDRSVVIKVKSL